MPDWTNQPLQIDIVAALIGLCVGSFLNVLALRSLKEESVFHPPSHCPHCQHRLSVAELIPVISYFAQNGKCRHCAKPIAWFYPVVEALTAVIFVVLVNRFGLTVYGLGMLFFASTLIAVTITDFKEKLIPHEITYPTILLGIVFSSMVRHDFFSTLAGVGISYILFDFLGFYGLKAYLLLHKPEVFIERKTALSSEFVKRAKLLPLKTLKEKTSMSIEQLVKPIKKVNEEIAGKLIHLANGQPVEEIEVMGGGDAVLAALIASWLGLTRLALALILGFLVGSLMGAIYLFFELYKRRMLKQVIKPMLLGALFTVLVTFMPLYLFTLAMHFNIKDAPWLQLFLITAGSGALLGMVRGGSAVSKPFPFGPALAIGAAVAIFIDPIGQTGQ